MLRALNCSQGQRYLEMYAEQRPANESFVYGWMRERVIMTTLKSVLAAIGVAILMVLGAFGLGRFRGRTG